MKNVVLIGASGFVGTPFSRVCRGVSSGVQLKSPVMMAGMCGAISLILFRMSCTPSLRAISPLLSKWVLKNTNFFPLLFSCSMAQVVIRL